MNILYLLSVFLRGEPDGTAPLLNGFRFRETENRAESPLPALFSIIRVFLYILFPHIPASFFTADHPLSFSSSARRISSASCGWS